jgi:glycosyltransferase involved in cell wall biosynthesis
MLPHDQINVAIIVPTYRHPVLLTEALESGLGQKAPFGIGIVIVSDGCPLGETDTICTAYACSRPNVVYLRQANGGPGSARNKGIDYVLSNWSGVDALFFLDADNKLSPGALEAAYVALKRAAPHIGWVYTNVDAFGMRWSAHFLAPYSPLLHVTTANMCDTGSLI